mgnify:FL=1
MKKIILLLFSFCFSVVVFSKSEKVNYFDVKSVVEAGDICRTEYIYSPVLPLNQGNGRFGSSFSQLGLHVPPALSQSDNKYGNTHFMHIEHYGRGKFNADYLLPLLKIYWNNVFSSISSYRQHQSFYDGTIETSFIDNGHSVKVRTWFDALDKDLSCISIDTDKNALYTVVLEPEKILSLHYGQEVSQSVSIVKENSNWKFSLSCLGKQFVFFVKTNAKGIVEDGKLFLTIRGKSNNIQIFYKGKSDVSLVQSLQQTKDWWHQQWEKTSCIKFSDPNVQKMWIRSMALFLATFNDDKLGLAPPTGFAGNSWPFPFPQDLSYIHSVLLSTGNMDIAKSWIEYFSERIEGMKAYTKRLLKVDGILFPWVFPYGPFEGFHDPIPPNKFYYEIHNSGYLAKMAYETSIYVNNVEWTKKYALPLIREAAIFYKSISYKESDGLWHLFVEPSMGQDEKGGFNQKDYLCALYSAKYCFQKAIVCGLDDKGEYKKILKDGLAFASLKSEQGFYYSCQGRGVKDFGQQKHPVQLNELAFLPMGERVSEEALNAYNLRYKITQDAQIPYFYGWTLGEFLLAGSRVGNTDEWLKDWNNMLKSDYIDPNYIQIYETSKAHNMSYYVTTNGLIVQSLINNLVCDWYGELEIAKCYPWLSDVHFKNIHSLMGVSISGSIVNREIKLYLHAWKDTSFYLRGKKVTLKKGDKVDMIFNL